MKRVLFLGWLALAAGGLFSCQRNSQYHHTEMIPSAGWDMNQTLYFQDSLRDDAPDRLHLEVELRHSNLYPYQNMWVYLRTRTSDGTNRLDSINWILSEPNGKWLGKGWGSFYSLSYRLPDLVVRRTLGKRWFVVEIQHGLKDESLTGIESIGVHLFSEP